MSQKQNTTQKQITIVKIDNRRQQRKRSNAVSAPPPPVLRGVSAIQPIVPLPQAPDLYETNRLRDRIIRLERTPTEGRERNIILEQAPVRRPQTTTEVQTDPIPQAIAEPEPVITSVRADEELENESELIPIPIPTSGRFSELRERMRLPRVDNTPIRRTEPDISERLSMSSEETEPTPAPAPEPEPAPAPEPMGAFGIPAVRRPPELSALIDIGPYRLLVREKTLDEYGGSYEDLTQRQKDNVKALVKADVIRTSSI
jgi:hypothetical protein